MDFFRLVVGIIFAKNTVMRSLDCRSASAIAFAFSPTVFMPLPKHKKFHADLLLD